MASHFECGTVNSCINLRLQAGNAIVSNARARVARSRSIQGFTSEESSKWVGQEVQEAH
jgi:hypothetical protein